MGDELEAEVQRALSFHLVVVIHHICTSVMKSLFSCKSTVTPVFFHTPITSDFTVGTDQLHHQERRGERQGFFFFGHFILSRP